METDVSVESPFSSLSAVLPQIGALLSTQDGNRFVQRAIELCGEWSFHNEKGHNWKMSAQDEETLRQRGDGKVCEEQRHWERERDKHDTWPAEDPSTSEHHSPLLTHTVSLVIEATAPFIGWLCCDQFGNYTVQRMLQWSNTAQRERLAALLSPVFSEIAVNAFGTRVVQRLMDVLQTTEGWEQVENGVKGNVVAIARDQFGMHCLLKIVAAPACSLCRCADDEGRLIESVKQMLNGEAPPIVQRDVMYHTSCTCNCGCSSRSFVVEEIVDCLRDFMGSRHLCSFVQKALSVAVPRLKIALALGVVLKNLGLDLVRDSFANYLIQDIMLLDWNRIDPSHVIKDLFFSQFVPTFFSLSVHKFASNAMEKLLLSCDAHHRSSIISLLLSDLPPSDDEETDRAKETGEGWRLLFLMCDPYGNYVLQQLLNVCGQGDLGRILHIVRSRETVVRGNSFGKKILLKLTKIEEKELKQHQAQK